MQHEESAAEVGVGVEERMGGSPELIKVLFDGCSDSFNVCVGDVGDESTHWEEFGRISPQGGPQNDDT